MLSLWKHPLSLFLEFLVFFLFGGAVWRGLSCFLKEEFGNVGQTLRVDVTFNVTFAFVF